MLSQWRQSTSWNVNHLLSGNPAVEVLGPFTAGDPDTEPLKCHKMVPDPAAYLHLLLDHTLTPRHLWEQGGGGGDHRRCQGSGVWGADRIPSTTPGAEPPRDARDSGSARSLHLETSSSDRP